MSIDELAKRLEAAAGEFSAFRRDLVRNEPTFDRGGEGARQVADLITTAWRDQAAAADLLSKDVLELSAAVAATAARYREMDDSAGERGRLP